MLEDILLVMAGAVTPLTIMIVGGRHIAKHPEYVAKMLAKKFAKEMVNSMKDQREQV